MTTYEADETVLFVTGIIIFELNKEKGDFSQKNFSILIASRLNANV